MMHLIGVALAVLSGAPVWASPAMDPARMNLISTQRLADLLDAWRVVGVAPSVLPDAPKAVAQGKPATVFPVPVDQVGHALLNSDGTQLIYLRDGTVRLRDVESAAERHIGWAQSASLSGDGRAVLLGNRGSYDVYRIDTDRMTPVGWAQSAVLSADGGSVILGDRGSFRVMEVETGRIRQLGWGSTAALSGDGRTAIIGDGRSFDAVEVETGRRQHLGWGLSAVLSDDGRTALIGDGRAYQVVDVPTGMSRHLAWGGGAQLSADGKAVLLSGPNNGSFSVCRTADLSCRHLARGRSARLSRDGKIALVEDGQSVYAYDTISRRGGHLAWGELMSLSANGLRAAVLSNGWVQIYDVAAFLSKARR